MASKEIKKKAQMEAQKETPKKGRRLKRSVRKTLGAISLAAAIAVAAIPAEGLQAAKTTASDVDWGTLEGNMGKDASGIPTVDKTETIYTTGDGKFQFAYVPPSGSGNNVAVILGYEKDGSLPNGALEIPNTVNAYLRRTDNLGTGNGYTAIGKAGNFLYYRVDKEEQEKNEDGTLKWLDEDKKEPAMHMVTYYYPCDYDSINSWFYADNNPREERALEDFWYYENNDTKTEAKQTTLPENQWIKNIAVRYIGNQYVVSNGEGGWTVGDEVTFQNKATAGVFAGAGNIVTLKVGDDMSGIGDYAFYGCTNLSSITLNNGLNTIGVGAFADCINMSSANIDVHSMVNVIGDYAFYRCRALTSFTVPNQVSRIGNSAFESCESMTTFTMGVKNSDGSEENGLLNNLGANVFKNCKSLKNISFKSQFTEKIPLTTFQGCSSLEYIEVANMTIDFDEDGSYGFAEFKKDVPSTFYFKGIKDSALHQRSTDNQVAFSYWDRDLERDVYELTVTEQTSSGARRIVYRVDDDDNLVYCGSGDKGNPDLPDTVNLPETIGPNFIKVIDKGTFQNRCELTMIVIPSTITGIESEAFKGCHQLEWVIFNNPNSELTIGLHAFQTQEGTCTKGHTYENNGYKKEPVLNFVGPISYESEPFDYAMRKEETIDNGNQPTTYIKYHSGWPAHLVVRYNPTKDENELIDYPTLSGMGSGSYTTAAYKYLTAEQAAAMTSAVRKYNENIETPNSETLTTDEQAVVDAALKLLLPEGIEGFEDGLFIRKDGADNAEEKTPGDKTITAASLKKIDDKAFQGHTNLVAVNLTDTTVSIGTHAFEGCTKLNQVILPGTVEKMGTRPFAGCSSLSNVTFNVSPYFTCANGIIFELDSSGNKNKLVEYLEGRTIKAVQPSETEGITELYPEAFMDTNVRTVDLSNSKIKKVPESAFVNTEDLVSVVLPRTMDTGTIVDGAFANSGIEILTIPGKYIIMTDKAFGDEELGNVAPHFKDKTLMIICEEGSMAEDFADNNKLQKDYKQQETIYIVRFFYYDRNGVAHQIGEDQEVLYTKSAEAPDVKDFPEEAFYRGDNYVFVGFQPDTWQAVSGDNYTINTYAMFERSDLTFTVVFQNDDGQVLNTQTVAKGGSAVIPQSPTKDGYKFLGWVLSGGDGSYVTTLSNVQANMVLIARYRLLEPGEYDDGSGVGGSGSPGASGGPGGSGNPGASDGSGNGNGNGNGTSGTFYNLTVVNGSGSGSYLVGSQPVIIANDPASGQVFDHWTVSPSDVKIASSVLSASIITMPASDVTVTAHYKAGSGNGTTGSGSTGSGNNNRRPNGVLESGKNGGTTVVIDKNGLSNTGVVSATVNGSSDNFTIKITETAEANEAALRALMAEYGDNLDNIKYFPMDISLYDSTGTNRITDTSGLSISITLPLPDSLITYAGNNMVASTAGNRLERLSARFSTIQGVSCITFTAEHFSPYVIYVNTRDLSSGLVSDDTPKTGDFIHPKWFLSIGLACLSFVLFMQKDTRKQKKVKVKVRA